MTKNKNLLFSIRFVLIIIGFSILIVLAGVFYYKYSSSNFQNEAFIQLKSVSELKSRNISEWYKDEMKDANLLAHNPFLVSLLESYILQPDLQKKRKIELFIRTIIAEHGLDRIFIVDNHHNVVITSRDDSLVFFNSFHLSVPLSDTVSSTEIHSHNKQYLDCIDFISPILIKNQKLFIVFQHDASSYLFPFIATWPTETKTAESVLVQNENDSVLILNKVRDSHYAKQHFKISLKETSIAAVQAVLGLQGEFKGKDYRGKDVIAYIQKIPNTPWFIVSKIDQNEIYESMYKNALLISIFIVLIIAFLIFAIAFLFANKQRKAYKHLYKAQQEFRTTLYSIGDGVITTDKKGRVKYMNPIAEKLTGWTEMEAQGKPIQEVFVIINEDSRSTIENPVSKVIEEGAIVGLANHTILIHKDLSEVPIADSGAPIRNEDGDIIGVVLVFRNQFEERKNQRAIAEANRKLALLVANLQGVAYSCENNANWDMNFISDACFELTDYSPHEFIHEKTISFGSIIYHDDRQMVYDEIQKSLSNRKQFKLEYRIVTKQNKIKWVLEQGQGVFSENGELLGIEGYIVDISLQKKIQEELAKSNQILQLILDTIPLGVFWKDLDLKYLGCNKNFLKDTNVANINELIGKTDNDLRWNDEALEFHAIDNEVITTGIPKLNYELEYSPLNNQKGWLRVNKIPLRDNEGNIKGILGMYENITEQKKTLQELRESEELYRCKFENHSAIKLLTDPLDGKIININEAGAEFYGWPVETLKTMNLADIDVLGSFELIQSFLISETKPDSSFQAQHKKADGSICTVEVFSSPINIRGKILYHSIVHDITDKKEVESQLKLQSRAIEQSPVSIVITNPKGNIEYVNPKFCKITGYSFQEVIGKNPSVLKSGYQSAEFYKILWDTIVSGKDWSGELHNKKKNGELFWEQAIISPILNPKGEIVHFVAVKEDITEKKKMLEDLILAKEKAEESDKLKTAFLANMSHEIRTPMNGIIGFSEMLIEENLAEDKRQEYAKIVVNSSKQLLIIVNDILDISRIEAGEIHISIEKFAINHLIHEIYLFFKPQALKKGIDLEKFTFFNDNDCYVESDKDRLRQILINLVSNAIKFTNQGTIIFGYTSRGNVLEFFVKDTGIGIVEQMQDKIFDRFRQAELDISKQYGGTGLGLSISQKLVGLLGGELRVESEIDKGSMFYFTIPHNNSLQKSVGVTSTPLPHTFNNTLILVAEDNDINFQLLEATFSKSDVVLLRAVNGKEAIEMATTNFNIKFVLMDLRMPEIDGITASIEIKKIRPELPIVVQSAYKLEEERKNAIDAGCDDYLSKPIKKQELINCLAKYLK